MILTTVDLPVLFSEIIVLKTDQLLADVVLLRLTLCMLPFNIFNKISTIICKMIILDEI